MTTIIPTKLFRLVNTVVVHPEVGAAKLLQPGMILWMHGSRKSSIDGYIGTFDFTYQQAYGYSPVGNKFCMKTDHVEPLE